MRTNTKLALVIALSALAAVALWQSGALGPEAELQQPSAPRKLRLERGAAPATQPPGGPSSAPAPAEPLERAALVPDEPAPTARYAALEVETRWKRTGAPAADCVLRLVNWGAPWTERLRGARTDAEGRARIEGIHPGRLTVSTSRGAGRSIELAAGDVARLKLEIPPGFVVRGMVVDAAGEPVGGARLWLSAYFNYTDGSYVGTIRPDGSFELEEVPTARYLGAIAEGHAPSHLHYLPDFQQEEGGDVELILPLNGPGGELRLAVVGPDGGAVGGACVRVEGQRPPARELPNHKRLFEIPTFDAWTDARGSVELAGLPLGRAKVEVAAAGFAPYRGYLQVEKGPPPPHRIVLANEAAVLGRVTREGGEPAGGAQVWLADDEPWALRPVARAREDGSYALRGLSSGRIALEASLREFGSASATLELAPGAEARWDPVLSPGRVVSGHILGPEGRPLEGWTVRASVDLTSPWRAEARTDAEGTFRLVDCQAGPLELELYREVRQDRIPVASRRIAGNENEVLFRVGTDELPDGSIIGRIVDTEGAPVRAIIGVWVPGAKSAPGFATGGEGRFRAERLPAGRYELNASPEGRPRLFLGTVELRPREELDLGTLPLEPPGLLRLTVAGELPSASPAFHSFNLSQVVEDLSGDRRHRQVEHATVEQADEAMELHPGRYLLRAHARDGYSDQELELIVASGEERAIDVEPRAGRPTSLGVSVPEGAEMPGSVRLRLLDEWGREQFDMATSHANGRRYTVGAQLALGRYMLEASAPDGRRASGELEVVLADGAPLLEFVIPLQ